MDMMRLFSTLFFLLSSCLPILWSQSDIGVRFDTVNVQGLPGLHAFAVAQHEGKWLLIGGRKDGLHPKNGGFQTSGANQSIYVVDIINWHVWERSLAEFPDTLQAHLRSANMAFLQRGETLLFTGGYGRSETAQNHITYPYLTLIDLPGMIGAVVNNDSLLPHFQVIRDTFFAVTGGQLQVLNDTFYLVGGHRFEGLYAANAGANNIQVYTNAIRKFTLQPSAAGWFVDHKSQVVDELNLHRRDYNLLPVIFENGESGLGAFSGVFQPGLALLPFLNVIEIGAGWHHPVNGFSQFLANYHCAKASIHATADNQMHTLFFGGMSQYQLNENDSLIKDNRVPFVKTASRVSRLADGSYEEAAFNTKLPFYTGSGAEFLLNDQVPTISNGIVDLDALPDGETHLGYIVGGIFTPDNVPNPFVSNQTGLTSASSTLVKVLLQKNMASASVPIPLKKADSLEIHVSPNPATHDWKLRLKLPQKGELLLTLQNAQGQIIQQSSLGKQVPGEYFVELPALNFPTGAYWLTANLDGIYTTTIPILKN